MGDVDGDCEGSDPGATARLRVRCWSWCMGNIALWLELGSGSHMRMRARLGLRVSVRRG